MKLIGDLISDAARALGFKECGACMRRKKKLNALHERARRRGKCPECVKARRIGS